MKNKALVYIFSALVSFAVGLGGVYLVKKYLAPQTQQTTVAKPVAQDKPQQTVAEKPKLPPVDEPEQNPVDVPVPEQPATEPEEETVAAPVLALARATVTQTPEETFNVEGLSTKLPPVGQLEYKLFDKEEHVYTSTDGRFENVAPNAAGSYTLIVTDTGTGKQSGARVLKGFVVKKAVERLTEEQVASILNTGNAGALNAYRDHFVDKPKVNCNQSEVSNLSGVFQGVSMDGYTATVSDLEYDSLGRIVSLTVTLN